MEEDGVIFNVMIPLEVGFYFFSLLCGFLFQSYFYNDDTFNFNYAQAKAAMGDFSEAEEVCIYFL